jgi:TonB family protein
MHAPKQSAQRLSLFVSIICIGTALALAQDSSSTPFAELDKQLKQQQGGWNGSKQPLATLFNAERMRLGERFEPELLKYLGTDTEKHYWIASFLNSSGYLHGNKPLPHLALLIRQQGLSLLRGKTDQDSQSDIVRLSITAAVLSEQLGLHHSAVAYKSDAERLVAANDELRGSVPAMYEEERKLYDSIGQIGGKVFSPPMKSAMGDAPKIRVSGGVLNSKAIEKSEPVYPESAKEVSGQVVVAVVVDETGKVISARAVTGHELLRPGAQEAAYKWKFAPLVLKGTPVRVSGTIIFKFTHQ